LIHRAADAGSAVERNSMVNVHYINLATM